MKYAVLVIDPASTPVHNRDFDEFPGVWSKEEADRFDAVLFAMRQVDPVDWELRD
jgi:hypothetical protein